MKPALRNFAVLNLYVGPPVCGLIVIESDSVPDGQSERENCKRSLLPMTQSPAVFKFEALVEFGSLQKIFAASHELAFVLQRLATALQTFFPDSVRIQRTDRCFAARMCGSPLGSRGSKRSCGSRLQIRASHRRRMVRVGSWHRRESRLGADLVGSQGMSASTKNLLFLEFVQIQN